MFVWGTVTEPGLAFEDERCGHSRNRDARLWPSRRSQRPRHGCSCGAGRVGRCRPVVARRAVRNRREPRWHSPRQHGDPARTHRNSVHQRGERLRHGRNCAVHRSCLHQGRHVRRGSSRGLRQARAWCVLGSRSGGGSLVRRVGSTAHHAVLRDEDQALHARARHQPGHPGQGGGEGVSQWFPKRHGVASQTPHRRTDSRVDHAVGSAHPVHVLQPGRGCCGAGGLPGRQGQKVHQQPDLHQLMCGTNPAVRFV